VRESFEKVNQKAQPEVYHCAKVEQGECNHKPFQRRALETITKKTNMAMTGKTFLNKVSKSSRICLTMLK